MSRDFRSEQTSGHVFRSDRASLDLTLDSRAAPVSGAFGIDVRSHPEELVLAVRGEADAVASPLLAQALQMASRSERDRVVLDLAALEYIDARCLGVIANAREQLRENGSDLVLRSPAGLVQRVLTVTELEDLIERPLGPADPPPAR